MLKTATFVLSLLASAVWAFAPAEQQEVTESRPPQEMAAMNKQAALEIGRAYVAGISSGNLDQLDRLFVPDDASTVFENASNEGSWGHYKEHHLAPEQKSLEGFQFTTTEEVAEECGDAYLVRHLGTFSIKNEGESKTFQAAISFTLRPTKDGLRILHMHWSSREAR